MDLLQVLREVFLFHNACVRRTDFLIMREKEKYMTNNKKSFSKKAIIGGVALVVVIAAFVIIYSVFRAKPVEGIKTITIEVVNMEQESTFYELMTDAEYLHQAMDEAKGLTFNGEETEYGITVDTVNGEKADMLESAYWAFYVNGDYCLYGIDEQPVMDGDAFKIEYTIFVPWE